MTFLNATLGTISASAYAMIYLFQGERWDPAVNQFIMGYRVLLPTLQRFSNEDPIVYGGGDTNYYRFVRDNPTNASDPSGLDEIFDKRLLYLRQPGVACANCHPKDHYHNDSYTFEEFDDYVSNTIPGKIIDKGILEPA